MSERASQTAQRYVDAMNIASAKIEQLQAEVEALRAQVQRVRELHKPVPGFNNHQWCDAQCEATCDGDATDWPCGTIRALDGDA
jgi:hypothetical protein